MRSRGAICHRAGAGSTLPALESGERLTALPDLEYWSAGMKLKLMAAPACHNK